MNVSFGDHECVVQLQRLPRREDKSREKARQHCEAGFTHMRKHRTLG